MVSKKYLKRIIESRPEWYRQYHSWSPHVLLHWTVFVVSCIVIMLGFINVISQFYANPLQNANASTASTTLTQNVNGGTLNISNSGNQTMTAVSVSSNSQTSTGSLGTITVTDNRGTGVGWNTTATCSQFFKYNTPVVTGGSSNTLSVNSSATFSQPTGGTYTITIPQAEQ